jgi:predicted DNA-binding protein (MmcQ/YjbR family)
MFFVLGLDQSPTTASFKVRDEEFDEMCNRPGFKPAPYVAKYKWVWIDDINKMKKAEWQKYLKQSYDLVKDKLPGKLKKQLGVSLGKHSFFLHAFLNILLMHCAPFA